MPSPSHPLSYRTPSLLLAFALLLVGCEGEEAVPLSPAFDFDVQDVAALQVTYQGDEMRFIQNADRSWFRHSQGHLHAHVTGEGAVSHRHVSTNPVDDRFVREALDRLASLEAAEVVDGAENLAAYGLDRPTLVVRLQRADDPEAFLALHFAGRSTSSGLHYYLHAPGSEHVFVVPAQRITPVLELFTRTEPRAHQH